MAPKPAAAEGDEIVAESTSIHTWTEAGVVATKPCSFVASLNCGTSTDVLIQGRRAATLNSSAESAQSAEPAIPDTAEPKPQTLATIAAGSKTVLVNGKSAIRSGDAAQSCGASKVVVADGRTVFIGD